MRYFVLTFVCLAACNATKEKVLGGTVEISPDLKAAVKPEDTVYVIARKGAGGPPLLAKRLPATAFPLTFLLTEKDLMTAAPFEGEVELSVRIDKDGDAMTKNPGDLVGKAMSGVKVGDKSITVLIDTTL